MVQTKPWGTTRESVAAWCPPYDVPPGSELKADDAMAILAIIAPADVDDTDEFDDITHLAVNLDEALSYLDSCGDGGDLEEIRDDTNGYLEQFYGELRRILHPELVAAEVAEANLMCGIPLPGLGS